MLFCSTNLVWPHTMNVYIVGRDRLCATPHTDDGGKARSRKKRRLIEKNGLCNECFDRGGVDVVGFGESDAPDLLALTFESTTAVRQRKRGRMCSLSD